MVKETWLGRAGVGIGRRDVVRLVHSRAGEDWDGCIWCRSGGDSMVVVVVGLIKSRETWSG